MRTLCLNLHQDAKPSVAENFLIFSPRVHYRDPGLVFLDVSSTANLFGGEAALLNEALQVSRDFYGHAEAAIADTPWGAQALCAEKPNSISLPHCEWEDLKTASLSRLHQLEGLVAWHSIRDVEQIVDFFHRIGISRLSEISGFQVDSFRQRWQETGTLIWKRLHGLDKQVISPLLPSESVREAVYLDFGVSLLPFLLHCLERALKNLMARLQGRGEFAKKIQIHLFCEYSNRVHLIELQPASPNRNLELFMKLIENKLSEANLDNPIKHFEIEVIPTPERTQQLSFFEPRVSDKDKLCQLVSVFHQAHLTSGFLNPLNEILPENSWETQSEYDPSELNKDDISIDGQSFQIKPAYSESLARAPRPSRILKKPKVLSQRDLNRHQFLSAQPIERLEDGWWETSRGRDYYFALNPKGEFVWIFYDSLEDQHYLHGYFD